LLNKLEIGWPGLIIPGLIIPGLIIPGLIIRARSINIYQVSKERIRTN